MPVEGGAPAYDVLATVWKVSGIGDEPDNPRKDRDAPAQALCEGQGGAWLPLLPLVRQDLSGGHLGPRVRVGESQQGRAWGRWCDVREGRGGGEGGVADGSGRGAWGQDVPAAAGASRVDPEARWRRAAARHPDDT